MARVLDWVLGRRLATREERREQVGVAAGMSVLGLDALASAAYGSEAALTLPIPLGAAGAVYLGPIIAIICVVLARGVRETGFAFAIPRFAFLASLGVVLGVGAVKAIAAGGSSEAVAPLPRAGRAAETAGAWMTAASELARNVLDHGGGGHAELEGITDGHRRGVRMTFVDEGPGIADLEQALRDRFSTAGGLGLGLSRSRRLVSEFHIESVVGRGTRVQVIRWK